ncbi:hypothetical protein EHQ52_18180 [Leptospira koniambonensis]|uniref:Uncharacterized protein n=1 Tax=Leptospira koniambonensis TaxID=2484950 RepID=A0A4R9J1J0_9LEPT|nr:hypothetical protein [Leptospira koniambonensis]TGL28201.1 hypothetical protein EHQ52_18180 [Leptospira koniambonensis]
MFKEYLQYIFSRGQIRFIVLVRSILILFSATLAMQAGGAVTLDLLLVILGIIGTYAANGFVIRSKMDPEKPVKFSKYFIFLLPLALFLILYLLIFLQVTGSFLGTQLEEFAKKKSIDQSVPYPVEFIQFFLISTFVSGLIMHLLLPVIFSKLSLIQGLKELPNSIKRSDYIMAAWTPLVIMFAPVLLASLISSSEEMTDSVFGKILQVVIFFFMLTSDIFLQYPTYYLIRTEKKTADSPEN